MPQTFAGRIFATFAVIVAIAMLGFGSYVERLVSHFHHEQARARLDTAAMLLTDASRDRLSGRDEARLATRVVGLSERDLRVTLIDVSGDVLFDSAAQLPLENHGRRPEVIAAVADGIGTGERRSATTRVATYYLARRVDGGDGPLGVVRVAMHLDAMARDIASVRRAMWITGLLAVVVALAGSAVVARYLARPLVAIQESAARLANGAARTPIEMGGPIEVRQLAESIKSMSRDLEKRLETLLHQRSEIEAVLRSMSEGVVAVGPNERILMMNEAAAHLLGLPAPLEPGDELWKHCRVPELEAAIRQVLHGGQGWQGDASVHDRVVTISASPVQPSSGAVAILSDVTSIRRLEQVRIDFVANVSHEMRTPLAAVLGALETLADRNATVDDQNRFLDIARRNADRMQDIVSDLLELSHIEAEGDAIHLTETSIEMPVRASAGALAGEAEAKGVDLHVHRAAIPDLMILGNDKRLEQIFTNLIGNAIKYTPRGGSIDVRVEARADRVCVSVKDTGVGIPRDALPRVFERFYRVDKSRSREMGGTGLGLAIVKHATRAQGGRVEVDSEEGRGTTFRVTFPRVMPSAAQDTDPRAAGVTPRATGKERR